MKVILNQYSYKLMLEQPYFFHIESNHKNKVNLDNILSCDVEYNIVK